MKKLFFASVFALATLTACNNETPATSQEETQNQTFQSKSTTAKGEELPPLTPTQEREMIADAVANVKEQLEAEYYKTQAPTGRKSVILCHTSYNSNYGSACVYNGGYLVHVTWTPQYTPDHGTGGMPIPMTIQYQGEVTSHCSC